MSVPVFTAVTGSPWEVDLMTRLERAHGVDVVRRCVDLADLLAVASTGAARAALLSANLRRLDRDALARLASAGVVPVGIVAPEDAAGAARLRSLGVRDIVPCDATGDALAVAVATAVQRGWEPTNSDRAYADPAAALSGSEASSPEVQVGQPREGVASGPGEAGGPEAGRSEAGRSEAGRSEAGRGAHPVWPPRLGRRSSPARLPGRAMGESSGDPPAVRPASGRLVAVWGPTGAPGRTTVAVGIASELAAAGLDTVLADADVYGAAVAQVLGLLDEAPGLAAAARQANSGTLVLDGLARLAPIVSPHLRVLTGLARPDRWPELPAAALEPVWELTRRLAPHTVVDCGFSLERDEELSFDTAAPRRNGATLLTLESADVVVAVGAADPVGVTRLVRALSELREAVPGQQVRVVLNKLRRGPVGADPERQLAAALHRYAGVEQPVFVPYDQAALDAALLLGRPMAETAPQSPARRALRDLAVDLAGRPARARGGRLRRPVLSRGPA